MKYSICLLVLFCFSLTSYSQLEWPQPPQDSYANKIDKTHVLDFVYLDVTDWEKYCALDKSKTNQEIPARITYFTKDGEKIFSSTVGARLSGVFIRKLPQKSVAIDFSVKRWQSTKVNYPIFPTRSYDDVDSFVIRAHGNPKNKTYFKDAIINETLDEHTELVYSAYRPVIVYINGIYNGLFNLREKKNKDLLSNLYGIKKKQVKVYDVEGGKLKGQNAEWENLIRFVKENDLSIDRNYKELSEKLDINDLIDYHLAHVFFSNTDWPKANVKVWKQEGGKWRYIFFDCDRGYNSMNRNFNSLEHLIGENQWAKKRGDNKVDARLNNASLIIRKLALNQEFVDQLILRYQDLLNTTFSTSHQQEMITKAKDQIYPEVQKHIDRWLKEDIEKDVYQYIENMAQYDKHVNEMMIFAKTRPDIQRKQLNEKWNLKGNSLLSIKMNIPNAGNLKINTVIISDPNFSGSYFNSKKITLLAVPKEGYEFIEWKGYNSERSEIELYPKDIPNGLTAIFKKI